MPAFLLACLAYLGVAMPGSVFGLLWPSMRLSFGVPVGALGIVLFGAGFGALDTISRAAQGALAVAGLMILGLAAVPVFPLLTLTTGTSRMVGLQVAASAAGSAALPAGLGLVIGAAGAQVLGPSLLVLGLAMAALFLSRRAGRAAPPVTR